MSLKLARTKPRILRCMDVYKLYAKELLTQNPTYWSKYNYILKISNYVIYTQEDGKVVEVISYPTFRRVIETYYTEAKEAIINGGELNLGNGLGAIAARRVERNYKNKSVNFQATAQQPKNEKGKPSRIIYYMDEDWCRIGWIKSGKVRNMAFYKFEPTPADMQGGGFKHEFSRALMMNPMLKYKYRYYPYILDTNDL